MNEEYRKTCPNCFAAYVGMRPPPKCPVCEFQWERSKEEVTRYEVLERLRDEADRWVKMYAWMRRRLAEEGFEVIPQDIRDVVGDLTDQGIKLTQDNLIRALLGEEKYKKWEEKGASLGEPDFE